MINQRSLFGRIGVCDYLRCFNEAKQVSHSAVTEMTIKSTVKGVQHVCDVIKKTPAVHSLPVVQSYRTYVMCTL